MPTRQSCCASFNATARPTPLPAPVMTAVLFMGNFSLRPLRKPSRPLRLIGQALPQRTQRFSQRNAESEALDDSFYSGAQVLDFEVDDQAEFATAQFQVGDHLRRKD